MSELFVTIGMGHIKENEAGIENIFNIDLSKYYLKDENGKNTDAKLPNKLILDLLKGDYSVSKKETLLRVLEQEFLNPLAITETANFILSSPDSSDTYKAKSKLKLQAATNRVNENILAYGEIINDMPNDLRELKEAVSLSRVVDEARVRT